MKLHFFITMKSWIRSLSEREWLIFIQNVILNVTHFVMCSYEISMIYRGTLFDPKIFPVTKVLSESKISMNYI